MTERSSRQTSRNQTLRKCFNTLHTSLQMMATQTWPRVRKRPELWVELLRRDKSLEFRHLTSRIQMRKTSPNLKYTSPSTKSRLSCSLTGLRSYSPTRTSLSRALWNREVFESATQMKPTCLTRSTDLSQTSETRSEWRRSMHRTLRLKTIYRTLPSSNSLERNSRKSPVPFYSTRRQKTTISGPSLPLGAAK